MPRYVVTILSFEQILVEADSPEAAEELAQDESRDETTRYDYHVKELP